MILTKKRKKIENIFMCMTPLQSLIAKKIILHKKIEKNNCMIIFYTPRNNKQTSHYYNELSKLCLVKKFYYLNNRFPKWYNDLRKLYTSIKCNSIYVATLDSIIIHLALSFIEHNNIFTYDDGLVNIVKPDVFLINQSKNSVPRKIAYKLIGNKFNVDRIKNSSKLHYTIYKNYKNIVTKKSQYIKIFEKPKIILNNKSCNIILGTAFSEWENRGWGNKNILNSLMNFIQSYKEKIYFINHPRGEKIKANNLININSFFIAEEIIFNLLNKYENIKLFGFMSSVQINLEKINRIKNYYFIANPGPWWQNNFIKRFNKKSKNIIEL